MLAGLSDDVELEKRLHTQGFRNTFAAAMQYKRIPMEIIRDVGAQFLPNTMTAQWNANTIANFQRAVVVHEVGHDFGLGHSGSLTNASINAMTSIAGDADERNASNWTQATAIFTESDIRRIREHGRGGRIHP